MEGIKFLSLLNTLILWLAFLHTQLIWSLKFSLVSIVTPRSFKLSDSDIVLSLTVIHVLSLLASLLRNEKNRAWCLGECITGNDAEVYIKEEYSTYCSTTPSQPTVFFGSRQLLNISNITWSLSLVFLPRFPEYFFPALFSVVSVCSILLDCHLFTRFTCGLFHFARNSCL